VQRLAGIFAIVVGCGALVLCAAAPSADAAQSSVTISGACTSGLYCFTPSHVTINDGDTVVWTNVSGVDHTVTRCDPAACNGTGAGTGTDGSFTSANVGAGGGATFAHTFHGSGTYNYYCQVHGYLVMHGTITVLASTPPTTSAPTPTTVSSGTPGTPGTTAAPSSGTSGSNTTSTTVAAAAPATLARTGAASSVWAGVGIVLVAAGIALIASQRRRATR
jgi:plastocyanin